MPPARPVCPPSPRLVAMLMRLLQFSVCNEDVASFPFSAEKEAFKSSGRSPGSEGLHAVSPSPVLEPSGFLETGTLTHSGGTAPVSHRTSQLGPLRAPEAFKYEGSLESNATMKL